MDICVTGASSGIGRAIVKQLIREGYRVWATARRKELLTELKQEVVSERLFISTTDVLNKDSIHKLTEDMQVEKFTPHAFIFAHGAFFKDIAHGFDLNTFKKDMLVNSDSTLTVVNTFLQKATQNKKGHFIVLSSISAFRPNRLGIGYPASKAAIGLAFRGLALAYQNQGVAFSTIYLGPVATEMWEGKKSFLVPTPEVIATHIVKILHTKRSVIYLPFLSTTIMRLLNFLPDSWYAHMTSYTKNR